MKTILLKVLEKKRETENLPLKDKEKGMYKGEAVAKAIISQSTFQLQRGLNSRIVTL